VHRVFLSLIVATCSFPVITVGSTVYSNVTTDTFDTAGYSFNNATQIGDEITLAGTDRLATDATVQFFSDGSAGTFDATLELFSVIAGSPPVGTQIGTDFVVAGIGAPGDAGGDEVNVTFTLPNLLVPDNLIFLVSVRNLGAGVDILGVDMYEPPTIGSSDPNFAIAAEGGSFVQVVTADEDVFFQLDATSSASTPEPTPAALVGSVLLAIAVARRRFAGTQVNR
jgi:hypothetical protein